MSERRKSQKGFVAVTLITLLAIAAVLVIYAALLGTFPGGEVNVVSLDGKVKYSRTNSSTPSDWKLYLNGSDNVPVNQTWYAMFNTTSGGYKGYVNITWELLQGTTSIHNETTNNYLLNGNVQQIYVSSDGDISGNYNWGQQTTTAGTYRIKVHVNEA